MRYTSTSYRYHVRPGDTLPRRVPSVTAAFVVVVVVAVVAVIVFVFVVVVVFVLTIILSAATRRQATIMP